MTHFTDANGERITTVTAENLQDFFKYVEDAYKEKYADVMNLIDDSKGFDYDIELGDDVKLDDFFAGFEGKKSDIKNYFVSVAEKSFLKSVSEERKEECRNLVKTHPEALEKMYNIAAYRTVGETYNGSVFDVVYHHAQKQNLSDNLYLIDALIDERDFNYSGFEGKYENIRTLPKDKAEIVAMLFADAKAFHEKYSHNQKTTDREAYSYRIVQDVLARGDLLNYEPKNVNVAGITAREIREQIEKGVSAANIAELDKKFIFDGKRANKDLLKLRFESQLNKSEFVQTEGEQKVHDAKQMRTYVETRDMVLDAAESVVGKYIPNSRGEERTNTQKFKALIETFYDKPYNEFSGGAVAQDYLLSAAHRDINAGNADKLEKDELLLVVQNDKDGYWLKKINEKSPETAKKIIQEMNGSFSVRQSRVADVIAPEITLNHGTDIRRTGNILENVHKGEYGKGVADSILMSTAEKEEFLDKAAVFVDENLLKKAEQDKKFAAEFRKDYDEHTDLGNKAYAKERLRTRLTDLQGLYADIEEKLEAGHTNEAEKHLSRVRVEEMLKDFPQCQGIDLPIQGKLPLLFGRKKEEERRTELVQRIRKFNDELMSFQQEVKNPQNAWAKYMDLSEYKEQLLRKQTVKDLEEERNAANAKVQENGRRLSNKYYGKGYYGGDYNYNDAERAEVTYDETLKKSQIIEAEKQKVLARKQQLAEAARDVNAPETSNLQAVTADMDKNTKASVRQANKQITDTLEKPVTERIKKVRGGRK